MGAFRGSRDYGPFSRCWVYDLCPEVANLIEKKLYLHSSNWGTKRWSNMAKICSRTGAPQVCHCNWKTIFLLRTNTALRVLYELDDPRGYLLSMFRENTQWYGIKGCTIALLHEKEKPSAFAKWQVWVVHRKLRSTFTCSQEIGLAGGSRFDLWCS